MARSNIELRDLAVTLDRYQELLNLPAASFNGLNRPEDVRQYVCPTIWNQSKREALAIALQQGRENRERELGYNLRPRYVSEEYSYGNDGIVILDKKHLIAVGVESVIDVENGVELTHEVLGVINDPVTVSIALPSGLSGGEVHVFYPDEDVRIFPSKIIVSDGTIKIDIPRSRLVKPELNDDRDDYLSYHDSTNFLETVDVKYSYTTPVDGVLFVWNNYDCLPNCEQTTQQGCGVIYGARAHRLSKIEVSPGLYTSGVFAAKRFTNCNTPNAVRVSYYSGIRSNISDEMMTIRLAHTLMPNSPCPCDVIDVMFRSDSEKDDALVTPYGHSKGATAVWLHDMRGRIGHGGMF